jgi:hypothetical protein
MLRLILILPVFLTNAVLSLAADVKVSDRTDLVRALQGAKPGTVILIAPGKYEGGLSAAKLSGEKGKPIILKAADAEKPPVFEGGGSGIHLSGCSWVELDHLTFSGAKANGVNIDDGGTHGEAAKGIVLRNLIVTNALQKGNRDGIKLSGLDGFTVSNCRVERWGSSGSAIDMVGCHDGVVENSTFEHDPAAAPQANGVQAKGGSARIVIRRCRFKGAGGRGVNLGGNTGAEHFRPAKATAEAAELTVEDCHFTNIQAPVAFVGVDGAIVRHNTIEQPGRWAMRILQENTSADMAPCRKGSFTDNIVVFRSDTLGEAVNVGPGTEPNSFTFARNVWFCADKPAETKRRIRLPSAETDGTYGTDPRLGVDGRPAAGSAAAKTGIRPEVSR